MPSATLGRDYFPFIRENAIIENGVEKPAVLGYFSTIQSTTRFFGIQQQAVAGAVAIAVTRKKGKRVNTRLDGTTVTASAADKANGGSQTSLESGGGQTLLSNGNRGSKTVRLKSGKVITEGQTRTFSCSFRFPSFCTNLIISNALGDLLPPAKVANVGATVTAEQVYPYFISAGGKRYPIVAQAAAQADTAVVVVPSSASALSGALPTGDTAEAAE